MPSAKSRILDESSETSSTVTNLKDKGLGVASGAGLSKARKASQPVTNGIHTIPKPAVISHATTVGDSSGNPSRMQLDWSNIPLDLLHNYRAAYRLATPSSHTHPHADIIYNSSTTALRCPSAVSARRRLRDYKHQKHKIQRIASGKVPRKSIETPSDQILESDSHSTSTTLTSTHISKDQSKTKDNMKITAINCHPPNTTDAPSSTTTTTFSEEILLPLSHSYGPRTRPTDLATLTRKHFNAQQLNEPETIARFAYVVRQNRTQGKGVRTEGSEGDGEGWIMGSQGREVQRGRRGEVGFRLRFRPDVTAVK